ncbi:hypothetical protein [Staphylococcus edaphicus]|uniref:HTH araC/xylS-type domain-containing protein n=1 Tax=Staphylococcus edaphicus TaxID=1955013 RepID=A0A2C6WQ56_9STAP|nr:hypothetical protein [Staphylococcus edaphicus]PHK50519.1 hypothetical protein BTJ66_03455 [Staphylococcus edaphicus]UQW81206.1 hypothetical protein MNY58_11575 [Staphylococcus edaphicus]
MTILKNAVLKTYISNDVFYIHDYETVELISFEGLMIGITINNYYYYKINDFSSSADKLPQLNKDDVLRTHFYNVLFAAINEQFITVEQNLFNILRDIYVQDKQHTNDIDLTDYKHTLVKNVTLHINKHIKEKILYQQLATHFFVNNSFLSSVFPSIMHTTLSNYIVSAKVHCAFCDLLNDGLIDDVWQTYQFRTSTMFVQQFKNIKGHAPYPLPFDEHYKIFNKQELLMAVNYLLNIY